MQFCLNSEKLSPLPNNSLFFFLTNLAMLCSSRSLKGFGCAFGPHLRLLTSPSVYICRLFPLDLVFLISITFSLPLQLLPAGLKTHLFFILLIIRLTNLALKSRCIPSPLFLYHGHNLTHTRAGSRVCSMSEKGGRDFKFHYSRRRS